MNNFRLIILFQLLSIIPYSGAAEGNIFEAAPRNEYLINQEIQTDTKSQNITALDYLQNNSANKNLTKQNLIANPQLLQRVMEVSLIKKSIANIKAVLPVYQQSSYADPVLINYAKALIQHSEGNFDIAIDSYKEVLSQQPGLANIRYGLAVALYQNKQFNSALSQFTKLKSETDLSLNVKQSIDQAITAINQQEDWQFSANFYFKREKNINNAPVNATKKWGNGVFIFQKPQKANGIHIDLAASKRFNLNDDWYSRLRLNANGNYYINNKRYNEMNLKAGLALGYQNKKWNTEIEPFIKKRFFSNKPYSTNIGAKMNIHHQVNKNFSVTNTASLAYEKFDERHHLNGQRQYFGFVANYQPNPKQLWFAGYGWLNSKAKYLDDSYTNNNVFLGWAQEWPKGISSKVVLSKNVEKHKGPDFFNITRKDKRYHAQLSLWNRSLQFYKLTPRIIFSWNKTDSNHFYYDGRKDFKVNLAFSKNF